jgi:CRP-like cAMP-binding protein
MTPEQRSMLIDSVKSNFLFSHLSLDAREAVLHVMERVPVEAGELITRQGERGDHFYVVESGTYDIFVAIPGHNDADGSKFDRGQRGQSPSLTGGQSPEYTTRAAGGSEDEEFSEGLSPVGAHGGNQSIARASVSSMGSLGSMTGVVPGLDMLADAASAAAAARVEATWAQQEAGQSGGLVLSGSSLPGSGGGLEAAGNSHSLTGWGGMGSAPGAPLGSVGGEHMGDLVHTLVAPGPGVAGAHPSFGELALLYGKRGGLGCRVRV